MAQSPPDPDIFLERNSTRIRGRLDLVAAANPSTPTINLDPQTAGITLHRNAPENQPSVDLKTSDNTTVATLAQEITQTGNRGLLHLGNDNGSGAVRVESTDFSGAVRIIDDDTTRATIGTHSGVEQPIGGIISVYNQAGDPGVVFKAERAPDPDRVSGLVEAVHNGIPTGRIIGADAGLELLPANTDGGGVGIVGAAPVQSESDPDVFIDINDAMPGSVPRMAFDGGAGDVTLGREQVGESRPGVAGRIKLQFGTGGQTNAYLEAGSHQLSGEDQGGELILRRIDSGSVITSGWLRATGSGVELGSGTVGTPAGPAAELSTSGELRLAGTVNQGSIAAVSPAFVTRVVQVPQGELVEIELTVGDASALTFQFGDQATMNYEVTADVSGYSDARLWLGIDTGAAGTSTQTVRMVAGDGSVSITSETSGVSPPLATGQYPIRVKESGASTWADMGTVTIQQP